MIFYGIGNARTYKILVGEWAGYSPIHVAEAKGYWKELGIEVKLINYEDPINIAELFKDKRVDFSFDMIGSAVGMYMEGVDLTIIAETDWSHGGDKIVIKKDINPTDLKGKSVGVYFNKPSITYFLSRYLSEIGIKISDIRLVEMEVNQLADNFIDNRFPMIVCFDPEANRAEIQGNGKLVATSATYSGCIPEGIVVLKDILRDIPKEDVLKILKGWVKAVKWSKDPSNRQEYLKILNSYTFKKIGPFSDNDLNALLNAVSIHDPETLLERNKDNGGLYTYLKELREFLHESNMLKKDFKTEDIVDNRFMIEVLKTQM